MLCCISLCILFTYIQLILTVNHIGVRICTCTMTVAICLESTMFTFNSFIAWHNMQSYNDFHPSVSLNFHMRVSHEILIIRFLGSVFNLDTCSLIEYLFYLRWGIHFKFINGTCGMGTLFTCNLHRFLALS